MRVLKVLKTVKPEMWWTMTFLVMVTMVVDVTSLSGPNVCMIKQKYNITKRVKYRAPMSVRTYEWCFAMPPRCSKWNTEMRDVTRLETEERTAEMAVCCPGYKLKDVSCVPTCPSGKTGPNCNEECPPNKWGPSCTHDCKKCDHGSCDVITGDCRCQDGWQGESCETSMITTAAAAMMEQLLTTETASTKTTTQTSAVTTNSTITTTATTTSSTTVPTTKLTLPAKEITVTSTESLQTSYWTQPTTTATLSTTKKREEFSSLFTTRSNPILSNVSSSTIPISTANTNIIVVSTINNSSYNRTEVPTESVKIISAVNFKPSVDSSTVKLEEKTTMLPTTIKPSTKAEVTTLSTKTSTALTTSTIKPETHKPTTIIRQMTTTKLKPKEIWIKPAQKGESPVVEAKFKSNQEIPLTKLKHKEINEVTTPKTIIVSIIPTSVTYVTFKRIALTTASSMAHKNNISTTTSLKINPTEQEFTKPMTVPTTSTPLTVKVSRRKANTSTKNPWLHANGTKSTEYTSTTRRFFMTTPYPTQTTNSMSSTLNVANNKLNFSLLTTISSFVTNVTIRSVSRKQHYLPEMSTNKINKTAPYTTPFPVIKKSSTEQTTDTKPLIIVTPRNEIRKLTEPTNTVVKKQAEINNKRNLTSLLTTNTVTDDPSKDEETFHILTEPEHITAVMGDKRHESSTINLISVLSIAGGVMMAVITVAVVIVMLERCRKPRYEDVRKYNDIRMQVMIDNKDVPPPYVRSIFHTPLPDPPTSEKCHYQPISTLDRNLKQFMRPVVVQTISPLMLENFRGILECHYDHLPRRSQDMGTMQTRCSVAPSINEREELLPPPRVHSLTDSDIEAMKCEAKLDVIDSTTSEPLYAEIPCWRPPSAHAIEVVNLNGEAVTEL